MIDWANITFADLDEEQRRRVNDLRLSKQAWIFETAAEELRESPHLAGEIVDDLIDGGYLADHMSALRWVASLDLPPAA